VINVGPEVWRSRNQMKVGVLNRASDAHTVLRVSMLKQLNCAAKTLGKVSV
jgi:hypothetical protein